ncbi:hypothetical protein LWI28_010703 [Acer negundo]|uniref:Uncharacterized protein n=1 Tax=Acer negundo TaxID=4023 RepID=A0AAD5JAJ3_ACENE|nr:hypothetical protein LWI28_010703 [Acer negundo]
MVREATGVGGGGRRRLQSGGGPDNGGQAGRRQVSGGVRAGPTCKLDSCELATTMAAVAEDRTVSDPGDGMVADSRKILWSSV